MRGKILKGIAGFYYVHVEGKGLYECKAKGIFRNKQIKPLVGDDVTLEVISEQDMTGNIVSILDRDNELIRPAVANVSQALVIFAVKDPVPNHNMLTRFLIMMEKQDIDTIICFNKCDIASEDEIELLKKEYANCGHKVLFISNKRGDGLEELRTLLDGKTTVLAGPSGVGKSTFLNSLMDENKMETGSISEKIKRGKHTTRHSEIFNVWENTYVFDTPGFTSLYVTDMELANLKYFFEEFTPYENTCRFNGCVHISEPDCKVKEALDKGDISRLRYDIYKEIYDEIKSNKKY